MTASGEFERMVDNATTFEPLPWSTLGRTGHNVSDTREPEIRLALAGKARLAGTGPGEVEGGFTRSRRLRFPLLFPRHRLRLVPAPGDELDCCACPGA